VHGHPADGDPWSCGTLSSGHRDDGGGARDARTVDAFSTGGACNATHWMLARVDSPTQDGPPHPAAAATGRLPVAVTRVGPSRGRPRAGGLGVRLSILGGPLAMRARASAGTATLTLLWRKGACPSLLPAGSWLAGGLNHSP
jgi:hypothetical protein